jgi:hypothetical protein
MGAPFDVTGATHETLAVAPSVETITFRGAEAMPVSVTAVDISDAGEFPALLCAVTRKE